MPLRAGDILDDRESLTTPFLGSILLHVSVAGAFILLSWQFEHSREMWGSPTPAGGSAVTVNPVHTLPLPPRQGRRNPVANNTESRIPQAPPEKAVKRRAPLPEPDAIPLKSRTLPRPSTTQTAQDKYRPPTPPRPNQIYSSEAPALTSQMFAKPGSAGAVGVDQNSVLGSRFGAYAALLMQRVAEKWRTGGLEGVRVSDAIVSVDIFRNGSTGKPLLTQPSNNYLLDNSALRAVLEAAPFPPLPPDYEHDKVNVNFIFRLHQ
jgi:periplasmic protein TonB